MKIEISKATYIETDELTDQELYQSHAYYYQLGRKDVALKLTEEKEKRQAVKGKKEPVDENH